MMATFNLRKKKLEKMLIKKVLSNNKIKEKTAHLMLDFLKALKHNKYCFAL